MTVNQSSFKEEGPITFLAYADLKAWRRVKLHSGTVTMPAQVEYAGAGEAAFGVTMDNVLAGEQVAVMQFTGDGTFLVQSNVGTISEGDLLYGTASGMVTNVSSGVAQLIALQPAAAQYEIIEVMCYPYWSAAGSGVSIADAGNYTSTATVAPSARFDNFLPSSPTTRPWWVTFGGSEPSARWRSAWSCSFGRWSEPRTTSVMPKSMSSTTLAR